MNGVMEQFSKGLQLLYGAHQQGAKQAAANRGTSTSPKLRQMLHTGTRQNEQQVQRLEHHRGERRVGERQREVGRLVGVDEVVQRPAGPDGGGPADVDVQVDEVGAVGQQVGPRQPGADAEDQQRGRGGGQPGRPPRTGCRVDGVDAENSSDRSPSAFTSVTVA